MRKRGSKADRCRQLLHGFGEEQFEKGSAISRPSSSQSPTILLAVPLLDYREVPDQLGLDKVDGLTRHG